MGFKLLATRRHSLSMLAWSSSQSQRSSLSMSVTHYVQFWLRKLKNKLQKWKYLRNCLKSNDFHRNLNIEIIKKRKTCFKQFMRKTIRKDLKGSENCGSRKHTQQTCQNYRDFWFLSKHLINERWNRNARRWSCNTSFSSKQHMQVSQKIIEKI
mgnify:CR=1 FL=1